MGIINMSTNPLAKGFNHVLSSNIIFYMIINLSISKKERIPMSKKKPLSKFAKHVLKVITTEKKKMTILK